VLALHWFLPTGGDSREVAASDPDDHRREPDLPYLAQVAGAADRLGFDAVLTPCGTACEDAWISTASLLAVTERLHFLVAFRPGLLSPTLAAQMASTYQRVSGGRLRLNIVVGAEDAETARFGPSIPKETRYARASEFLTVMKGAWSEEPVDFRGEHYEVTQATTRARPIPAPPIYFGGASPAAEEVAADHADVYLAWGEPPAMVAERVDRMREKAADRGRWLRYGIRFHVISRPTADEAWAAAERLLTGIDPAAIAAAQADFASTASEGQRRMADLHRDLDPTDVRGLEVHPNVWAGVGLVRGGAGTTLVGSHAEVADRIEEYAGVGFDEFILSGYPHLEEAYWCGEGLLPELRRRGLLPALPDDASPPDARFSTFR
jgi:alkanesulfonate monooxygenase